MKVCFKKQQNDKIYYVMVVFNKMVSADTLPLHKINGQLSGFVCAYHSAAPGSSPKYTIYTFFIYNVFVLYLSCEKNKNKQKRGRVWPIFKINGLIEFWSIFKLIWHLCDKMLSIWEIKT